MVRKGAQSCNDRDIGHHIKYPADSQLAILHYQPLPIPNEPDSYVHKIGRRVISYAISTQGKRYSMQFLYYIWRSLTPGCSDRARCKSGGVYEINIPACLKRCGIETKLIIAESAPLDVHGRCGWRIRNNHLKDITLTVLFLDAAKPNIFYVMSRVRLYFWTLRGEVSRR